jgi:hypothetical protein
MGQTLRYSIILAAVFIAVSAHSTCLWAADDNRLSVSFLDVSASDSYLQMAQAQNTNVNSDPGLTDSGRLPGVAISMAIAPGIVLHGSGHFYAGRPLTGSLLLLAEAGSAYMAYRGATEIAATAKGYDLEKNLGESGPISRNLGLAVGGVMLFLSSWFYDMTGSPIAAMEQNQEQKKHQAPAVTAQITPRGVEVVIERLF